MQHPASLQTLGKHHGAALSQQAGRLFALLSSGLTIHTDAETLRRHAELREAGTILKRLRYSDSQQSLRADEVLWAMKTVKQACEAYAIPAQPDLFEQAAALLGADIEQQAIPLDIQHKIGNELQFLGRMLGKSGPRKTNLIAPTHELAQAI